MNKRRFDGVFERVINLVSEMAVTLKGKEKVTQHLDDIEAKQLPYHYQKNLMKLKSKEARDKAVEDILNIVFQGKNYNPNIHSKKQLQDELGKGAQQVLGGGSLFNSYLGRWLGTNINAEIIDTSEGDKGASKKETEDLVTDVVNDVAKEVSSPEKEPETVKDAAQELKSAANGEAEVPETAADKKPSEYVGTIGLPIGTLTSADKRKIKNSGANINVDEFPYNGPIKLKVASTRTFATQGFGYYQQESTAYMTSFEGEDGAVYVWIATFDPDFKEGEEVVLERATVKNHKDYVNKKTGAVTKQTVIKRPNFQGKEEAE